MNAPTFETRFARNLESLGVGSGPTHLLVALSGGLDSTVLLHLLRFPSSRATLTVTAAHFDHAMRPSSAADAAWVRGLCSAWEVPLEAATATEPLRGETDARAARYTFLRETATRIGADLIATAHHADDQAETVLFRILRGTGLRGLRGIPARTRSGIIRPLLPFWREEIEAYARANDLAWRTDPTNASHGPARNRIRLRLLPEIEREIAPAARRNLVALAELARESELGWRALVDRFMPEVVTDETSGGYVLDRRRLREAEPALATRLLRRLLRRLDAPLDRAGTRSALEFITVAPSGREAHLPGGVRIRIEFDRARIERTAPVPPDAPLAIEEPGEDIRTARLRLGGRGYRVLTGKRRTGEPPPDNRWSARFRPGDLAFPLTLRARTSGDRIRTPGGTRTLKKLMIERKVPRAERSRLPVLVDANGRVVWVAGLGIRDRDLANDGDFVVEIEAADD